MATFSDLPLDILHLINAYLDVPSFLAFTAASKDLADPSLSLSPTYWYSAVHNTFRVPNQPVVSTDGARWKKLYKRLLTQTKPYTWGLNSKGQLGHSYLTQDQIHAIPPAERMRRARRARQVSWPEEMEGEGGIIADLQAGGWGTTYLTSKGCLYTAGTINGQDTWGAPPSLQAARGVPVRLKYPPGWVDPESRYEAETALGSFSMGRAHVLGLSDKGRIWSWSDAGAVGAQIKLLGIDLNERGNTNGKPLVKKVVAGWGKSAALVRGTGVVLWQPVQQSRGYEEHDTMLVMKTGVVPRTSFERASLGSKRVGAASPDEEIGEVQEFVVLEHCIIFNTHLGKVFASWVDEDQPGPLFEIFPHVDDEGTPPPATKDQLSDSEFVTDVQGTFRSFALFMKSGEVLNGTQDLINDWRQDPRSRATSQFMSVPALQNKGVIKLAFGDHHFLALHKDGYITSYGTESQGCGSLGLGGNRDPEGRLRGIRYAGLGGDGKLVPHAYTTGRRVWFEPEKREWIKYIASGGYNPQEAVERIRMCSHPTVQAEVSEWIEQEGNAWADKYSQAPYDPTRSSAESTSSFRTAEEEAVSNDNLAPYFALSVTAAGWHSGALVLVNGPAAKKLRENCIVPEPLPTPEPSQPSPTQPEQQQARAQPANLRKPSHTLPTPSAVPFAPNSHRRSGSIRPTRHPRTNRPTRSRPPRRPRREHLGPQQQPTCSPPTSTPTTTARRRPRPRPNA
ncbi:regulator of chromosome condensation 1/beta-lactamase-inhibitor protein II [Elsinoe ampelina]|uniref:Regulator of chromosome condensation 1/beta-lactamase-inhibitor protein II n=1 Tax=Elsinoe ampelina TaxID=302913 RepID=A0A6A6GJG7_9PEZI|nr:regulator of chromosome condensation 1/beta-lactamase-inhibitor protein II [Elsinoe ampelina]